MAYDFQFTDGASPVATYRLKHRLPTGLSLSASGEITGTPSAVGTWKFAVKATNLLGSNTKSVSIRVRRHRGGMNPTAASTRG